MKTAYAWNGVHPANKTRVCVSSVVVRFIFPFEVKLSEFGWQHYINLPQSAAVCFGLISVSC
jgi:hypothetical protein